MIQRRGFLLGAAGCIIGAHAPAIVRASIIMPIRAARIETVSGELYSRRLAELFYDSTVYGQNAEKLFPMEFGVIERFTFITSPIRSPAQWP